MTRQKISLVIPAYNEEEALREVLVAIQAQAFFGSEGGGEILVVDDGSTDKTAQIARDAGVRVISSPVNMGYGFSLKRGIEAATHEYIVTIDADGTYPPDAISKLTERLEHGFDMVVGARRGRAYWSSPVKALSRLIFKAMVEFVVGRRIPDINSGFRAIRRSKILPILPDLSKGFSFSTSSTLVFFLRGYFVDYLPVDYFKRRGKTKVRHVRDTLRTLQILVDIIVTYNPIKLFMLVAFPPFLLTVIFFIMAAFQYHFFYFFFAGLVSFLMSLCILALGFFADMFRKK